MNTHQLLQFASAARNKNMTAAAKELGVSQPSVSQAVKKLEEELGVTLFLREGSTLYLTQYGKVLLRQAETALRSISNAEKEISDSAATKTNQVRLIARQPMGNMTKLLGKFNDSHPNIKVACVTPNERMLASDYDIALFASTKHFEEPNIIHVCDEHYSLCVPKSHRLAGKGKVALKSLRGEKFILSPAISEMNDVVGGMFEEAGFEPKATAYFSAYWDLIKLVEQGFGICIATDVSWFIENEADVALVPISDVKRTRSIYIKWPNQAYLSEATLSLIDYLCQAYRRFSDEKKYLRAFV